MTDQDETIPCELCGKLTTMLGTKRCDRCYELERRVTADPALAAKILSAISSALPEPAKVGNTQLERIAEDCQKDTIECYWMMLKELESKATTIMDRHEVECFYRHWNRMTGSNQKPTQW